MHINTSKIVQELLESKTYNDTSLYTDRTTAEILQEMEISRNLKINSLSGTLGNHDAKFLKIAKSISSIIVFVIWLLLVFLIVFLEFVDYSNWSNIWKILFNILSTIVFLWGPVSWLNRNLEFFNIKDYLLEFFTTKIFKVIKNWFDK